MFDTALEDFMSTKVVTDSALSLGEQLYSARGSQSIAVGSYVADTVNADPGNMMDTMLL